MSKVQYKNKVYDISDRPSKEILGVMGYSTVFYYPKDKIFILSEEAVNRYGCPQIIENAPEGFVECEVCEEYAQDYLKAFAAVENGADSVSVIFRSKSHDNVTRINLTPVSFDENGEPEVIMCFVADLGNQKVKVEREKTRKVSDELYEIYESISSNFRDIFVIDVATQKCFPKRCSGKAEIVELDMINGDTYSTINRNFISTFVSPEERPKILKNTQFSAVLGYLRNYGHYSYCFKNNNNGLGTVRFSVIGNKENFTSFVVAIEGIS